MKLLAVLVLALVLLPVVTAVGLAAAVPVAEVERSSPEPQPGAFDGLYEPSPDATLALAGVPARYVALYKEAGAAYGVDWRLLAAIGRVESDHGRNPAAYVPNWAGAQGPMQFIPSSWERFKHASGNPTPDVNDPRDAIHAAALYLKVAGVDRDVPRAIFAYNHAWWYVDLVLRWAHRYGYGGPP